MKWTPINDIILHPSSFILGVSMNWRGAQLEAARRIALLPIPRVESRESSVESQSPQPSALNPRHDLTGLVITLLEFESDWVAGFLTGHKSAEVQRTINRAIRRGLQGRGCKFRILTLGMSDIVRWNSSVSLHPSSFPVTIPHGRA